MHSHHTGSCLCGAVKFHVAGNFECFYLCHCSHCRKDTGSAHAANLFSSTAALTWISGEDKAVIYTLPGTRHRRSFCSVCGTALPYTLGGMLVVPAGSLDTALHKQPDAHIFMASRADWDRKPETLSAFEGFPG